MADGGTGSAAMGIGQCVPPSRSSAGPTPGAPHGCPAGCSRQATEKTTHRAVRSQWPSWHLDSQVRGRARSCPACQQGECTGGEYQAGSQIPHTHARVHTVTDIHATHPHTCSFVHTTYTHTPTCAFTHRIPPTHTLSHSVTLSRTHTPHPVSRDLHSDHVLPFTVAASVLAHPGHRAIPCPSWPLSASPRQARSEPRPAQPQLWLQWA